MSSSREGPVVTDRGQIDDDGDALAAKRRVPPDVLVDTEHSHTVEPCWVSEQQLLAGGQDGGVDGVPCRAEVRGDAADGHPVDHEAFQRPQHGRPRKLRTWSSDRGEVFSPDA